MEVLMTTNSGTAKRSHATRVRPETLSIPADLSGLDYLDAFELVKPGRDDRTPEQLARIALDGLPPLARTAIRSVHRYGLGLRLSPTVSADHVLGWRIAESNESAVRLVAESFFLSGMILVIRAGPGTAQLVTGLAYKRPLIARGVWFFIGPIHRHLAPSLMERAAYA
jgi:hypothetical protein